MQFPTRPAHYPTNPRGLGVDWLKDLVPGLHWPAHPPDSASPPQLGTLEPTVVAIGDV